MAALKFRVRRLLGPSLRQVYSRLPVSLKNAIPVSLVRQLRDAFGRSGQLSNNVAWLDERLWGGFSRAALIDLARVRDNEKRPARSRGEAAYCIARWNVVRGNFQEAHAAIVASRALWPKFSRDKRQYLLESLSLCYLGRGEEAQGLLRARLPRRSVDISGQLMLANALHSRAGSTHQNDDHILENVNAIFRTYKLAEIAKRDRAQPLSIDNIVGVNVKASQETGEKVSIIVPAYNAGDTIVTALQSLAAQSWKNIEVIVVDDRSIDDTADVVERFCENDARFRLIRQDVNGGSYRCRNRALREVTGDYVTIHDADDWAHPDRIACHVAELNNKKAAYNVSKWIRTLPDLFFVGLWRPQEELTNLNMGSFFARRSTFEKAGQWDEVRISADREYMNRVERLFGVYNRAPVLSGCPLVFGRVSPTSLTQTSATSVETVYHGIRREYHEASDHAHKRLRRPNDELSVPQVSIRAPLSMSGGDKHFDIVFIADWNMRAGTYHSARNMMLAAQKLGLRIGAFHYPRYDHDASTKLRFDVRDVFTENNIDWIAPGEEVIAETVVFTYPPVLNWHLDRFPKFNQKRLVVVVNQMASRDHSGAEIAYDPGAVRSNLQEYFGQEGEWVPISGLVRRLMLEDPRYPSPSAQTWLPLTSQITSSPSKTGWRGTKRKEPVIGRHGRDHWLKWPGNAADIKAAYCAGKSCEVRFLGGARQAEKIMGTRPENWTVYAFGSQPVSDFLADLDFFVHYPNEDYIEEFGRAPMEAMAAGVPVILPPVFRETFGDAAIYAEPALVWETILALWLDETAWLERVRLGHAFVHDNCSLEQFAARIN